MNTPLIAPDDSWQVSDARLPPPKLIVFDWDGTLVQSTGHIVRCFERAMASENLPIRPADQIQGIIGLGLFEAARALYPELGHAETESLAEAYRAHYFKRTESIDPYPGTEALLSSLRDAGCWLAIATGKSNRGLEEALSETGLGHYFLSTRTAEQTVSKPAPLMLMQLLDEFGVTSAQTWMIGDTDFDMLMAHNAGCTPVAITHGAHDIARLRAASPAAMVDELSTILDIYHAAHAAP
ncbi:MAG: HAD hydrolase-like protein [Halothiobacillus sp.]|jgi:phosphoglycolate phosphatase|nr:HAD hydrolase-like protein [Halothiobacillus sp.]